MRLLVCALLVVACGCSKKSESAGPTESPGQEVRAPADDASPSSGDGTARDDDAPAAGAGAAEPKVLAKTGQLLVLTTPSWTAAKGELRRFRRQGDDYQPVGDAIAVTIGRAGLGWGRGWATASDLGGPKKVEGDGRSPAGIFAIGEAYGYAPRPPDGTALPYQQVDDTHRCVDDPSSTHYNRIVSTRSVDKDWKSAEVMRRQDRLYRWVLEIDHNPPRSAGAEPGAGSCIFFHVWSESHGPTVGCAAMEQSELESLLQWIDPETGAKVVMLPVPVYRQLVPRWDLPEL